MCAETLSGEPFSKVSGFSFFRWSCCLIAFCPVLQKKWQREALSLVGSLWGWLWSLHLHSWWGLGGRSFSGIPFLSLPCHRRKCTMSLLTGLVMTKTITYTWRGPLMISKHFNIWSPICSSYQACEVNKAGTVAPSVQMRRQEQRVQGFPEGHPVH